MQNPDSAQSGKNYEEMCERLLTLPIPIPFNDYMVGITGSNSISAKSCIKRYMEIGLNNNAGQRDISKCS